MARALLFGLAFGVGFQSWRNYPADGPVTADAAALFALVAVLLAYGIGRGVRARRGPVAVAQAAAYASAQAAAASESTSAASSTGNTLNVAVVVPGGGARPAGVSVPTDAPWFVGERPQLSVDQLDGAELSELLEETPAEVWES